MVRVDRDNRLQRVVLSAVNPPNTDVVDSRGRRQHGGTTAVCITLAEDHSLHTAYRPDEREACLTSTTADVYDGFTT